MRSARSSVVGKPCTEGFAIMPVPQQAILDPAMVTMPHPTATHYRHAHQILESTSRGQPGCSLSKQGCWPDARSVSGEYGRWLVIHTCTRVADKKNPGIWPGKLSSSAAGALGFFCVVVLVPPICPRGGGGPRLGGKSRREERL
jgi:hypothetical protein